MTEEEKLIIQSYEKLPKALQDAISSITKEQKITNILQNQNLTKEELDLIEEEVMLVLIGIEPISDIELNIRAVLDRDIEVFETITKELQENIFKEIEPVLGEIKTYRDIPEPKQEREVVGSNNISGSKNNIFRKKVGNLEEIINLIKTDETLIEQFASLSEKNKQFILSEDLKERIKEILVGHPLQQQQIDVFGKEVMFVLLKLENIRDFERNIKHGMKISHSRTMNIANKTRAKIFSMLENNVAFVGNKNETISDGVTKPKHEKLPETFKQKLPRPDTYREEVPMIKRVDAEPIVTNTVVVPKHEEVPPISSTVNKEKRFGVSSEIKKETATTIDNKQEDKKEEKTKPEGQIDPYREPIE